MIHLVVTMQIKPGCRQAFLDLFNRNRPNVLAEDGCIQYQLCADLAGGTLAPDPDCFTLLEQWTSEAHLQAHLASAHMKAFAREAAPLRAASTLRKLQPC